MAVTKIIAIRDRLDKRVDYVANAEKTSLDCSVLYAMNPEKTEQSFFVTAVNCGSVTTAYREMMETKRSWHKEGGVLGYHFIQSFAPGEVTPEQAHAIGKEFVDKLFGNRYEVIIGTHLDKAHLHNHIVVNSVSYVDGKKYHSSPASYYQDVRGTSDALCRENDLSVIAPKGKGMHYAEWKAEKQDKPTIRALIREDIDSIITEAYTFQSFLLLLQKKGYTVKHGANRKYTTVQPPGAQRAIRLDSLGDGYTEDAIKERLAVQRSNSSMVFHKTLPVKRYCLKGKISAASKRKIKGFHALYFRYVYLLRRYQLPKRKSNISFSVRQEVIRLEHYQTQFLYLYTNGITTPEELERQIQRLEREIQHLTDERKTLYKERRNTTDEETICRCSNEIDRQTASLRNLRKELGMCRRIQADIPQVEAQVREAQEQNKKRKEVMEHEYQWRNR